MLLHYVMRGNIGAFIIRIGFGVYYSSMTIRNPQNPILIIKGPTFEVLAVHQRVLSVDSSYIGILDAGFAFML